MTDPQRTFLKKLADMPKGRGAFDPEAYEVALRLAEPLIHAGLVKARPLGFSPGFQIMDAGKAYLGGEA